MSPDTISRGEAQRREGGRRPEPVALEQKARLARPIKLRPSRTSIIDRTPKRYAGVETGHKVLGSLPPGVSRGTLEMRNVLAPLEDNETFVSTGQLPDPQKVTAIVTEAYEHFRSNPDGKNSDVYPALQRASSNLFGVCVVATGGNVFAIGDADYEFAIMSVSKPFVFALVCQRFGADAIRRKVGANATGLPFNSLSAVEGSTSGLTNPMVNAGAIATTSLVPGSSPEAKWEFICNGLSQFAGRQLRISDEVYASAKATNFRNRSIAWLLETKNSIYCDPLEATDLYTRQCSLNVTAKDLAVMGATFADGGVNPITKERVIDPSVCHHALAVMTTAGLYETSGDWLYDIGLPGKSGIGGGIVTVSPGKGGLGTFAPPLDSAGNSVKGQLVAKFLSQRLGLDLFVSKPNA
jgi:glutaminase